MAGRWQRTPSADGAKTAIHAGPFAEFARDEVRFTSRERAEPERARRLLELAQRDIDGRRPTLRTYSGEDRHGLASEP